MKMLAYETTVNAFAKVETLRRETAENLVRSKILKHGNYKGPERLCGITHGMFGEMAWSFTLGLINEINRFLIGVHHADCWVRIANDHGEDDRLGLLWEFADPFLELSVGRPYLLKNHFTFAATHLLHQANSLKKDWKDELPKNRYIDYDYLTKASKLGDGWKNYSKFEKVLHGLNGSDFALKESRNFRHSLQHQQRFRFDTGLTPYLERTLENGRASYTMKVILPLKLETLIPALYGQHEKAVQVFNSYWQLLTELHAEWELKKPIAKS